MRERAVDYLRLDRYSIAGELGRPTAMARLTAQKYDSPKVTFDRDNPFERSGLVFCEFGPYQEMHEHAIGLSRLISTPIKIVDHDLIEGVLNAKAADEAFADLIAV